VIQQRRHIFHVAGYDPISPQEQYRRFVRQLAIFKQTWSVATTVSEMSEPSGYPCWTVTARGPNWQGSAGYELFPWDDIVRQDAHRPDVVRLFRAAVAYLELIVTGTFFRYVMANARYFIFALFPLLQVGLLAGFSWYASSLLAATVGLNGIARMAVVALVGIGMFFLLLKWPGRRWRIQQALDDWILSHDHIHGKRPDLEARLDRFAERLVTRVREGDVDEIVVVGHSLGAVFAMEVVARALDTDPNLGKRGISLCVLTVGATIPKCSLHPAARRVRDRVQQVAREPSIYWAEYQARADAISFYRFDPLTLRRMTKGDQVDGRPVIRRVQIQDMVTPETFAKFRFHVLRLHYQFVMANNRRSTYDYFMMICGPVAVEKWTRSKLGLLDFFQHPDDAQLTVSGVSEPA
jgi:hypothetical protein